MTTILELSGLAFIAAGLAAVFWPAALIFSGVAMIVVASRIERT